jgi:3-oxoacyl-[acyl-carrier protein] reductase
MPDDLRGRVALVTGGSGGIGRALVARLAEAGCHVAVGYSAGAQAAENAAAAAREVGVQAVALHADLSETGTADALADRAESALGPIDVLVPNAGLAVRRPLQDVDDDLWRRTMAVNLDAPFALARRTVPAMAERGWGRVLFVSSVAAFTGGVVGPHYAASKAALHGLLASIASRYAERGVTANAIAPASVAGTAMLVADPGDPAPTPVGRLGTTSEVADLAMTMLGTGYLTGKVYLLDGGMLPR